MNNEGQKNINIVPSLETLSTHQHSCSVTSGSSSSRNDTNYERTNNRDDPDMDRVGLDASLEQSIPHPDTTNTLSNAAAADTPTTTAHSGNSYIYPEGGYGWIVLAATFVCSFWCIGLVFCWGVFQEYLLRMDIFGATSSAKELSWVGSLSCACIFVAAPVIVVLINKFGTAMVLASGVICVTTGFIAASFATTYWHLYITIGFLYGLGGCLIYFTCVNVLAQYFNKRRGVVVGVAISGSGIGSSVMAPLLHHMLYTLRFPWTMRIIGLCIFASLSIAVYFIRPYRPTSALKSAGDKLEAPRQRGQQEERASSLNIEQGTEKIEDALSQAALEPPESTQVSARIPVKGPTGTTRSSLDFSLFRNLQYAIIFISTNLFALVYLAPILLAPTYATVVVGLPTSQGALMITIVSSTGIVSRIVIGHLADSYGSLNATTICLFLSGLSSLLLWLHASHSFALLAAFMVFYGCFGGATITLLPVAASKAVPIQQIPSALGFIFLAHTIGYLLGTPLVQFIIEKSHGRFDGAIVFVGVINLLCAGIIFVARIVASRTLLAKC